MIDTATATVNKRYAEVLLSTMLSHGVLQKIGPDQNKVISDDCKKFAACFEQTELQGTD